MGPIVFDVGMLYQCKYHHIGAQSHLVLGLHRIPKRGSPQSSISTLVPETAPCPIRDTQEGIETLAAFNNNVHHCWSYPPRGLQGTSVPCLMTYMHLRESIVTTGLVPGDRDANHLASGVMESRFLLDTLRSASCFSEHSPAIHDSSALKDSHSR